MECSGLQPTVRDLRHGFALLRESRVGDDGDETLFHILTRIGAGEIWLSVDCNGLLQFAVDCGGLQVVAGAASCHTAVDCNGLPQFAVDCCRE